MGYIFSENRILSDLTVGSDGIPTFKDPSVDSSLAFLSDFVGCLDPIRSDRIYSPGIIKFIFNRKSDEYMR